MPIGIGDGLCRRVRARSASPAHRLAFSPAHHHPDASRKFRVATGSRKADSGWWLDLSTWCTWWHWLTCDAFSDDREGRVRSPPPDPPVAHCDWWWLDVSASVSMPLLVHPTGDSPVRVTEEAVFASPRTAVATVVARQGPTPLQLSAHALTIIYSSLVSGGMWDASFARGSDRSHGERGLAAYHLSAPATDGWNVLVGALELARVWAIRPTTTSIGLNSSSGDATLDRSTRTRLAVCLAVSWKFQRAMMSSFAKRFQDIGEFHGWPHLLDGHTRELAHIGYGFLFKAEQQDFGGWSEENVERIRGLYSTMLRLEMELIRDVPLFTLLTENVQVEAETRLWTFYEQGDLTVERCMAVRSILPFFVRASTTDTTLHTELMGACDVVVSAGGLVCAGYYCMAATFGASRPLAFVREERTLALELVSSALSGADEPFLRQGCYGNPMWEHHCFVTDEALRTARRALSACGPSERGV